VSSSCATRQGSSRSISLPLDAHLLLQDASLRDSATRLTSMPRLSVPRRGFVSLLAGRAVDSDASLPLDIGCEPASAAPQAGPTHHARLPIGL
jgi:hypothetical protein